MNITGINFWNDAQKKVDFISSNRKAVVMVRENSRNGNRQLELSVSDPTQANNGTIEIELQRSAGSILKADPEITAIQLEPTIRLKINVAKSFGKAFHAEFALTD